MSRKKKRQPHTLTFCEMFGHWIWHLTGRCMECGLTEAAIRTAVPPSLRGVSREAE